jgi:tRNA(Arg) A34 adenosine deaminase TadA
LRFTVHAIFDISIQQTYLTIFNETFGRIFSNDQSTHAVSNTNLHFDGEKKGSFATRLSNCVILFGLLNCLMCAGFYSIFLYRRWYRCHVDTRQFGVDTGVIDRRHNISFEEFVSTYDGKKPVYLYISFLYNYLNLVLTGQHIV